LLLLWCLMMLLLMILLIEGELLERQMNGQIWQVFSE
jgi:hypothetical protein